MTRGVFCILRNIVGGHEGGASEGTHGAVVDEVVDIGGDVGGCAISVILLVWRRDMSEW